MDRKIPDDYVGPADDQQMAETLYEHIESKDYWIFIIPWSNESGAMHMNTIEMKYYAPKTEANGDFHMILMPMMGSVTMAKKNRMSEEQLSELMPKGLLQPGKDVFMVTDNGTDMAQAEQFFNFIKGHIATIQQIRRENNG